MFTLIAITIAVVASIAMFWPLLARGRQARNYGLSLVIALPVLALLLYQQVGTPLGIGVSGRPVPAAEHSGGPAGSMADLVAGLEQRMQENPADLEGWVLLGRSYKTMQQYAQAEAALLRAVQIAPDNALVLAELAEAQLFSSGSPEISIETQAMLERALELDPEQQKALWLLGIAASQRGDDATAIQRWQKLLSLLEPGSPVAQSVREQLERVQGRTAPPARTAREVTGEYGLDVVVEYDGAVSDLPSSAVLFVIVRDPAAPMPPLGAKRVSNPDFPATLTITDADSMMAERPISDASQVELLARISMAGSPMPGEGDAESSPVTLSAQDLRRVELHIPATPR